MTELEKKLVEQLHSIAAYNDKGIYWMRHSPEETQKLRAQWRDEVRALVQEIGQERFSPELLSELLGGVAVQDDSGDYARKVEAWLSKRR